MSLDLDLIYPNFNLTMDKSSNKKVYQFESFRLDGAHRMLYRGGEEVSLAPKAVETLLILVERRGEILSKEELMDAIWTDAVVEESNLAKYLHVLRKTLGERQNGVPFIETFRRRGYRFNGDVEICDGLPQNVAAVDTAKVSNPEIVPQHSIEQYGNVLRFVEKTQPDGARLEAVPQPDPGAILPPQTVLRRRFPLVAACVAIFLFLSLFFLRNWNVPSTGTSTKAKNDLSILRLTNGSAPLDATISPKGDYFVYHEQDGDIAHLWLQQTGQSKRVEIISPVKKIIGGKTFSPDGQYVYFVARDSTESVLELFRVPTLGGTPSKILKGVSTAVSFSPDGQQMVFRRDQLETSLIIANAAGTEERVLLTWPKEQGHLGHPEWSPDGARIAYSEADLTGVSINSINLQTGVTEPLSPEKWANCYRIGWTRDGEGLVFIGTKLGEGLTTRRDQVYYLSILSGDASRLTTDGNRYQIESLGITENDEILAVPMNRSSQIWEMNANGDAQTAARITGGAADGRAGLAALPDGRIAYIARMGNNINVWLSGPHGEDARQLTFEPPVVEEVRSAADGSFLIFSSEINGMAHLYRIDADGSNLRQLTFDPSYEVDSTVSPAGKWIVYTSQTARPTSFKTSLQKIPSEGGQPVLLADFECRTPHYSPDGKFISCFYENNLAVVSSENGALVKVFKPVETPYFNCGAKWSPDGRDLIYVARRKDFSNLWRQPVDGGKPQPLTDFTSDDIYNFAFSTDGSRLYVARGSQIRDVVLIKDFR